MRIRTAAAALGITLAGAAFATIAGAGSASAITPLSDPGHGIYLVVLFDQGDTVALNNSPIPGVLDQLAPDGRTTMLIDPASRLPRDDNNVYATVPDVVSEAARQHGEFGFGWYDPNVNWGNPVRVIQVLP
ncbi:hypothetical protein [Nocardia sp. NBC_01327]|uniref:hypothetical protein n=1 Tax=Nocardia sp. NBC_01327 TaxID=2903593 RepID=UPI002E0F0605|nr:hypothetical protein OG326_06325 [Nocardia sp. NBC_01327]